ncbi:hypothetical protein [Lysobacter firmicutimachus]|uniref:Uncharacterized protein n=1 Tax=Lysobacter firmicutimachus TaxID=1792846 RepID=A0ABU8D802_9GAMM
MSAGGRRESIRHDEEHVMVLADSDRARYPQLHALWDAFYDSPTLSPLQAGAIVHELIELLDRHGQDGRDRHLIRIVLRWLAFFSHAARGGHAIETLSD